MTVSDPLFAMLRHFAASMVRTYDVDEVLHELCEHAISILGASGAGVSVAVDDGLFFVTSTGADIATMEAAQEKHQAGPCIQAYETGAIVVVPEIAHLDGMDEYRRVAAELGFSSVVGIALAVNGLRVGSLNVYDVRVRDWNPDELDKAQVIADVATAYLVRASELAAARNLNEQLQAALDSRILIEQAKGMLARDHRISVDHAFELLRTESRTRSVAMRDIAREIVAHRLELEGPTA